jgi:hypothetical protein
MDENELRKQIYAEELVKASGKDPALFTVDDAGFIVEKPQAARPEPSSALEAGAKAARNNLGSALGGLGLATAAGAAATSGGLSLIPTLLLTTAAGVTGSAIGEKGQEMAAGKEEGKEFKGNALLSSDEERARLAEEHPVATFVGGNVPMLLGGRPRYEQLKNLSTASRILGGAAEKLTEPEKHALGNLAANVAVQGYGTGKRLLAGEKINPLEEVGNLAFASSLGSWKGKPAVTERAFPKPAESDETVTIGGKKATPTEMVPETSESIQKQFELALDPNSPKKAVFVTKGSPGPKEVPGMAPLDPTKEGTLWVNPSKYSSEERASLLTDTKINGRDLGYFNNEKPTGDGVVVTTAVDGVKDVITEVVPNDPKSIESAIAHHKASYPSGETEVVNPADIILHRKAQPAIAAAQEKAQKAEASGIRAQEAEQFGEFQKAQKAEDARVKGINKVVDKLNAFDEKLQGQRAKADVSSIRAQEAEQFGEFKKKQASDVLREQQSQELQDRLAEMDEQSKAAIKPTREGGVQPIYDPFAPAASEGKAAEIIAGRKAAKAKASVEEAQLQGDPRAVAAARRRAARVADRELLRQEREAETAQQAEAARLEAERLAEKQAVTYPTAPEVVAPERGVTKETYVGEEVQRPRVIPEAPSVPRTELGLNEPARSPIETKAALEAAQDPLNPRYRYSGAQPEPQYAEGQTVGRKGKKGTLETLLQHLVNQGVKAQKFEGEYYNTEGDPTSRRGKWGRNLGIEVNDVNASDTTHEGGHWVLEQNPELAKRFLNNPEVIEAARKANYQHVDEYVVDMFADKLIDRYENNDRMGLKDLWENAKYVLGSKNTDTLMRIMENRFLYGAQKGGGELTAGKSGGKGILDVAGGGKYSGTQQSTPAFKNWFGKSQVTDEEGKPLVVYHGTYKTLPGGTPFSSFNSRYTHEMGTHFGTPDQAADFSHVHKDAFEPMFAEGPEAEALERAKLEREISPRTYATYLKIENPLVTPDVYGKSAAKFLYWASENKVLDPAIVKKALSYEHAHYSEKAWKIAKEALVKQGYDGIKYHNENEGNIDNPNNTAWIAFDPTQIKSATGNAGTFGAHSPDIRYSGARSQKEIEAEMAKTKALVERLGMPRDNNELYEDLANKVAAERALRTGDTPTEDHVEAAAADIAAAMGAAAHPSSEVAKSDLFNAKTYELDTSKPMAPALRETGQTTKDTYLDLYNHLKNRYPEELSKLHRDLTEYDNSAAAVLTKKLNALEEEWANSFLKSGRLENPDIRYSGATGSALDAIKKQSPEAMDAAEKMFNERTVLRGELGGDVINKLQKFNIATVANVMAKHQDVYRNGTTHTLTGDEAKISKILQDHWNNVRDLQRKAGYERDIVGSEYYVPEMISNDVRALLDKGIHDSKVREIIDTISDHWIKGGMDPAEAPKNAEDYVIGLSGARFGKVGMPAREGFDPLRTAAGLGLPEKTASGIPIRETDPLRTLQRYGDQAATDMAYQKEVASKLDPKLLESLRTQSEGPWQTMENLYWNQDKVNLPTLRAANKLVTTSVLGPISKAVEVATNPQNAMAFGAGFGDVGKAIKRVSSDFTKQYDKAVKGGIITPRSAGEENFGQIYGGGTPVKIMNKVSDFISTYTGTKFLEETSRVLSYSLGEATAETRKANGDAKWFKERGVDINDAQAVQKAASQMAEMIQGRRDARELPAAMLKGPLAEIAPIHRWAVGHSANLVKEMQQGNYSNFVGYMAAGLGVALGREELNKFIKGREGATPTMKELEVAKYPAAKTAAAVTDMLRSAGIGGALVDITNYGLKKAGNQNAQLIYNPLASAVQTGLLDAVPQFAEAVNAGIPPVEVAEILGKNILRSLSQVGAVAMDLSQSKEEQQANSRARNFRTFQNLVEDRPAFSGAGNPAMMEENRKFARTTDPEEMNQMLDILARRGNGISTPRNYMAPADPLERMRYMRYLEATGENEPGLEEDIYKQDVANMFKRAAIAGRGLTPRNKRLQEIMADMQ